MNGKSTFFKNLSFWYKLFSNKSFGKKVAKAFSSLKMPQNSQLAVNILRRWFFPLFLCKACNSTKKFQVQKFHYYYLTHFNFKRIICIDRNRNYYNYISAMRVTLCRHLRYVLITVPNVNCILSWSIRFSRGRPAVWGRELTNQTARIV